VVLDDNGQIHYFGNYLWTRKHREKEQRGSYTIRGHKIQSIALGYDHSIMVTTRGAIFRFKWIKNYQLGMMDPSTLLGDTISTPIEVLAPVTKFGTTKLPDGSVTI
jgi:alpha-tubulin suppressor-like RCC1 family protein